MNKNILKLYNITQKSERLIVGLMSGTSLDGLDVALCKYSGSGLNTNVKILEFKTVAYSEEIKIEIRDVFAKKNIDFQKLCLLNPWIGILHGEMVNDCLAEWGYKNENIDCIASHGQTVFHAPKILHQNEKFPNATLQVGDGDHVAVTTGIITLSDFRQKHCAAGGEGAPLAVYGDYLIFSEKGKNRILLNMGGISNFTFLSGSLEADKVFATDTGPGNTIMDAYMQKYFNMPFDNNGQVSLKGNVNPILLTQLKKEPFFDKQIPKTTGPEQFNLAFLQLAQEKSNTQNINKEDIMATLSCFTAETIVACIQKMPSSDLPDEIYMSGGGMHNPSIVANLQRLLPNVKFLKSDVLGINGDAKEAVLFATLANEALVGGNTNFGSRKGVPSVSLGKISFPK